MTKLSETFVRKIAPSKSGTQKHWDIEIKGLVLFVGKQSRTWYFQKDGGFGAVTLGLIATRRLDRRTPGRTATVP